MPRSAPPDPRLGPGKEARHALILEILGRAPVASQEELRLALARRGIHSNQATISRDCRELALVKTREGYALPVNASPRPRSSLRNVIATRLAGTLVVLKTPPGRASMVAFEIDRSEHRDVVGTIAGDDTVFVATPSQAGARRLARQFEEGRLP
ncbi:MAG: arginine repressor [Planctomycetota bacterium]